MHPTSDTADENAFPAGDMVTASELREFVYCERAWWLSRQGYGVSAKAQEQRAAGVVFHEQRAGAARRGSSNQALWWAILLILAAIALWLAKSVAEMPR
jgi:CRISPR/Cas system-associated exonuclease Cas4 (RecB family)